VTSTVAAPPELRRGLSGRASPSADEYPDPMRAEGGGRDSTARRWSEPAAWILVTGAFLLCLVYWTIPETWRRFGILTAALVEVGISVVAIRRGLTKSSPNGRSSR
jgi:hypothetical protein